MPTPHRLIDVAQDNRKTQTRAEAKLWSELRGRKLGVRFRREDPVGPYIADFSCRSHRLDIEADGHSHIDPNRDRQRDQWFVAQGWTVLRFANEEILTSLPTVLDTILKALGPP